MLASPSVSQREGRFRRRAACRAWRARAVLEAAPRPSRFNARKVARERFPEGFDLRVPCPAR